MSSVRVERYKNAVDYVLSRISCWRDRTALICSTTGKSITYPEIRQMAITVSNRLRSAGIEPGNVVGICAVNCLEYLSVLLGIWRLGAIAILLPVSHKSRELHFQISSAEPVAIYAPVLNKEQEKVLESFPKTKILNWTSEELLKDETMIEQDTLLRNKSNKIALLLSSSGTTGLPKLVVQNHSSVVTSVEKLRSLLMEENETALGLLPFFHAYGLGLLLMAVCEGTKLIVMTKYTTQLIFDKFNTYKISYFHIVPTFLKKLLEDCDDLEKLKSLRYIFTSGAPADPKTQAKILNTLKNVKMYHMFGMTELTHVVSIERVNFDRPGSVGRILPFMKAKVIGSQGEKLGRGFEGELCISGPTVMAGYYKNKAATQEAFTEDGWLRTGDLAKIDEQGYIYVTDRIKNIIKFNGLQICPSEIEQVITHIKGVSEAAVIGIPNEAYGEVPRAFVVKANDSVTEKDIIETVERELAYYKWLRGGVKFVELIPKTPLNKLIKKNLKNLI